jgi:hypothetical protein
MLIQKETLYMSDEIKNSYDLAMERLLKKDPTLSQTKTLSSEQKEKISEIRKEYEARIAESKLMVNSHLKKLFDNSPPGAPPHELLAKKQEIEQSCFKDIARLKKEMDLKIEKVRNE